MNGISVDEFNTVNTSLIAVSFVSPVLTVRDSVAFHRRRLIRERRSYTSQTP